ncbi:MAG: type IX secretion system sortase PorU [Bacteroidales bacterium]|nr:type IX secretion system sortase PorU [Bacteroidales bacterium]
MKNLFILLTLFTVPLFGQKPVMERSLDWRNSKKVFSNSDISRKYLFFEGAVYENPNTLFPYYNELLTTEKYYNVQKINITNPVYQQVSVEDLENIQMIGELPSEIKVNVNRVYNKTGEQALISILPLRRNPGTGQVEKLVSFSVEVQSDKNRMAVSKLMNVAEEFATESVLASGTWHKIKITQTGIYKLTFSDLQNMGISNPADVRVYGNGGKAVPLMNREPRVDDLAENAIFMEKGSDGIFNQGDYILFYAHGMVAWNYNKADSIFLHSLNDYSQYACYFLTSSLGPGKRITEAGIVTSPPNTTVTSFDAYDYHERNLYNDIKSGRQWFGEKFIYGKTYDTTFRFPNLVPGSEVVVKSNVINRSAKQRTFTFIFNNQHTEIINVGSVNINYNVGTYAVQSQKTMRFNSSGDNIAVKISYNKTEESDEGWLDYITVNARRSLAISEKPLFFRDTRSVAEGNIAEFRIQNTDNQTIVWDITDMYNIKSVPATQSGQEVTFRAETSVLREFVAFDLQTTFLKPVINFDNNLLENQNLHGLGAHKMIIVTHPLFTHQAERIAEYHRQKDNFSVITTTTEKVYNEFSSGMPDVSAIRDFARMIYERSQSGGNSLRYLLLFGDGSYNNISNADGNPNYIPTYQSSTSLGHTTSYVSDDFFGFLDKNEGGSDSMHYYYLDIGIGRLPASDTIEAKGMVDKILAYNTPEAKQDWRNTLLFVGDDQDGNDHMEQANQLADYIRTSHPEFVVKKILLDAYKQVTSSTGNRYPDVNRAILDNFNKGLLIFNYTGHGNENAISEEQILIKQDLEKLRNKNKYPLFITATCEFSRWDDMAINSENGKPEEMTSAGEVALLNPEGGAIALFTTTRVVYSHSNHYLNRHFYYNAFKTNEDGSRRRLGDIVRFSKIAIGSDNNKMNFTLLGDPAMDLAYADFNIVTDSINGNDVNSLNDTIKAFTELTVTGHVQNKDSVPYDNFNGTIIPTIFDKVQQVTTLQNDANTSPLSFEVQENLLFRGKASVTNGKFKFTFIVPKDISYTIGKGKINYYAYNDSLDANGYFSNFLIGGTSDQLFGDNTGPELEVYLNDENFRDGGISDKDPRVYVKVFDEYGINTTGTGIGHDIVAVLDKNTSNPFVMNDYYQSQANDYRSGEVMYQLNDIEPGLHTINVKVWDIFNNSSEKMITFRVIDANALVLDKVYNYPNPFGEQTFFQFEHNKPDDDLFIKIEIFDFSGKAVRIINLNSYASGYRSEPIEWDGTDQYGNILPNGVYPYRVTVGNSDGLLAVKFEKLMILK